MSNCRFHEHLAEIFICCLFLLFCDLYIQLLICCLQVAEFVATQIDLVESILSTSMQPTPVALRELFMMTAVLARLSRHFDILYNTVCICVGIAFSCVNDVSVAAWTNVPAARCGLAYSVSVCVARAHAGSARGPARRDSVSARRLRAQRHGRDLRNDGADGRRPVLAHCVLAIAAVTGRRIWPVHRCAGVLRQHSIRRPRTSAALVDAGWLATGH